MVSASRTRIAPLLSATIAALIVALLAATLAMDLLVPWRHGANGADFLIFDGLFGSVGLSFGLVGAIVASRAPRNPLPWLMALIGLAAVIAVSAGTYSTYDVNVAHGAPAAEFVGWFGTWIFQPALISAVVFVPLLFPNGRIRGRALTAFAAFGVAAVMTISLEAMFGHWSPNQSGLAVNPFELHGPVADILATANDIANVTGGPAMLTVLVIVAVRFRRSRGTEREQFKWFAYAAAVTVGAVALSNFAPQPASDILFASSLVAANLIPVAIGIAVLRYRLYDIDVVINRTLVYGLLVAVLAAVYAVSVLSLDTLLSPLTQSSSLAVAASTLLVAALFDPIRRRVRAIVDRRFYRRRYDAVREMAGFGTRLRDDVEPERLTGAIAATLDRTVQPAFASIWVREMGDR